MPRLRSRVRDSFPALLRDLGACSARCSWVQAVRNSNPWWNCVVHFLYERTPLPIVPTRQRGFYIAECRSGIVEYKRSWICFHSEIYNLRTRDHGMLLNVGSIHSAIHGPRLRNAISRRMFFHSALRNLQSAIDLAPYPSGKGEVCKTFIRRFESARRLRIRKK